MKTNAIVDKFAESSKFVDKENTPFVWRKLRPDEAILAYQLHLTANAVTPAGLVRLDDLAHFSANIQDQGRILGCFVNDNEMVAYGILGMDTASNSKLCKLLDLPETELHNFASLDGAAALAPWRGNRLHRESIQARLAMAREQQRRYIGATVSPENINSMRGLLEAGFCIKNFAYLYGGLARLVMSLDLDAPPSYWTLCGAVIASDQAGHQAALAKDLIGFDLTETRSGVCQVLYGVRKNG
ncbi:MAG: hypothetical protein V4447_12235 [Pseudomonadota bacterium]